MVGLRWQHAPMQRPNQTKRHAHQKSDIILWRVLYLCSDRPKVLAAEYPLHAEQAIYEGTRRAFLTTRIDGLAYEEKARNALEARIGKEGIEPNACERTTAEIATRENTDPKLVKTIKKALGFGEPKDGEAFRAKRDNLLDLMKEGRVPRNMTARNYVKAVFAVFTQMLIGMQGSPTFSAQFEPARDERAVGGSRRRASPIFSSKINPAGRSVVA